MRAGFKSRRIRAAEMMMASALLIGCGSFSRAFAETAPEVAVDQNAAHKAWRSDIKQVPQPAEGCFHASYPSLKWEAVQCGERSGYRSSRRKNPKVGEAFDARGVGHQVTGNGVDFEAEAPSGRLITEADGSFPSTSSIKTEKGVGVAAFGGGGVTGANQYTLQLNTNFYDKSKACSGSNCFSWQ